VAGRIQQFAQTGCVGAGGGPNFQSAPGSQLTVSPCAISGSTPRGGVVPSDTRIACHDKASPSSNMKERPPGPARTKYGIFPIFTLANPSPTWQGSFELRRFHDYWSFANGCRSWSAASRGSAVHCSSRRDLG
jgi:hypothetical protein